MSLFRSKKCLKESILTCWISFKIYDHVSNVSIVRIPNFGPSSYFESSYFKYRTKSEIRTFEKWIKIGFSKQIHHEKLNSCKKFSVAKRDPRVHIGNFWKIILYVKRQDVRVGKTGKYQKFRIKNTIGHFYLMTSCVGTFRI